MAKVLGFEDTYMTDPIGKHPSGKQDQGSNIDVENFAKVNTGLGGKAPIDSLMDCPFGKIPDGTKRDGIA